ncbi:MAG: hypothetical protein HYY44_06635 [Deltaproteobacteria bacterium]|nr:hypothetical protein [Deltaproteobacteria bacterium]MBI4374130.1 hypothetical protein [Deltaproteobacteria bacterium]
MENFLKIITQPDNIAILIMMACVITTATIAFREIIRNDRLIKEGKKEEIYRRMTQ